MADERSPPSRTELGLPRLMYAMFYMARYNLSVADPYLLKAFG